MSSGLIEHQHGMRAERDVSGDFGKMQAHGPCVASG
jgi:hypothetical protein